MEDEPAIDPVKKAEWIGHDAAVQSRRQSGVGMIWLGLLLFLVVNPLATIFLTWVVGGAVGVVGIGLVLAGIWRRLRAGTTSEEAMQRIRARNHR